MPVLSNLPPGVTESMIPGFDDDDADVEEYDPPCDECGVASSGHVEVYVSYNDVDGFIVVCPSKDHH